MKIWRIPQGIFLEFASFPSWQISRVIPFSSVSWAKGQEEGIFSAYDLPIEISSLRSELVLEVWHEIPLSTSLFEDVKIICVLGEEDFLRVRNTRRKYWEKILDETPLSFSQRVSQFQLAEIKRFRSLILQRD